MSKQFLHTCSSRVPLGGDGNGSSSSPSSSSSSAITVVVVALGDRAFVGFPRCDQDVGTSKGGDGGNLHELLEYPSLCRDGESGKAMKSVGAKSAADSDKHAAGESDGASGGGEVAAEPSKPSSKAAGAGGIEIQAVCSSIVSTSVWLAVSRSDKTLSLYLLRLPDAKAGDGAATSNGGDDAVDAPAPTVKKWLPTAVYSLPRRAGCLSFATVPAAADAGTLVVMAGDLAGDVNAYPIPTVNDDAAFSRESCADEKDCDKGEVEGEGGGNKPPTTTTRRLLLGHTASQLTGLRMVRRRRRDDNENSSPRQFILTANRDEKVRVSHFPGAHMTHGYLLGHSAFVSCVDAAFATNGGGEGNDEGRTLCITGGGDGTVRLWDVERCAEIGMVPVAIRSGLVSDVHDEGSGNAVIEEGAEGEETEGNEEAGNDKQASNSRDKKGVDESDDMEEDEEGEREPIVAVPHAVALNSNGSLAAVARDGISSIDVHPIPSPPATPGAGKISGMALYPLASLHKKETVECSSQPLAVAFLGDGSILALVRDPDYLVRYSRPSPKNDATEASATTALGYVPVPCDLSDAVRKHAKSEGIVLPQSPLEKVDGGVNGGWMLHKKGADKGHPLPDGQLPWNDVGRKVTAKKAAARRRKRKKDELIGGPSDDVDGGGCNNGNEHGGSGAGSGSGNNVDEKL